MFSLQNSIGYIFGDLVEHLDPLTLSTELEVMRHYIFLFDQAVAGVQKSQAVPKIKSIIMEEVVKDVIQVWKGKNQDVRSEKAIRAKLQILVNDIYKMKKNKVNEAGIQNVLIKYDKLFDI